MIFGDESLTFSTGTTTLPIHSSHLYVMVIPLGIKAFFFLIYTTQHNLHSLKFLTSSRCKSMVKLFSFISIPNYFCSFSSISATMVILNLVSLPRVILFTLFLTELYTMYYFVGNFAASHIVCQKMTVRS